ncbi:enoyl-CoA hydratase-related protein [Amycolatopsis echigonensis]|uniref:Crotonobetainyl-CoA hydratase n=1 Tax=Amycolatopsis echigonensis TaxID=2576905 RepID=A0A2N3X039_9PSEU|nr:MULTISPECIES: enoyl-CoA hydratase-related protein [Amycolatopsis]MBB2503633.1 enoyl-CoA hydratase/isomerase family protein [Amycolatopsis echigonensis]PKV99492.1 crotonobetainyl-CoA hydratase [Amycolatopsis niigatensis]
MTDEVRFEVDKHVARVTIDRPQVLNAVAPETQRRLCDIWDAIEKDPEVRVVVLTGAGERAFCVGADMSANAIEKTGLRFWADEPETGFGGLCLRTTLDVPVIARVNGYALGGGMEMVLGCDIVIAAEHAQFGLTEPRVGRLPLGGGVAQLVRRLPHTQAMGLLLTGRRAGAAELHGMGLVNEVAAAGELDSVVDRWVADVLACAPTSLRAIKQIVQRTTQLSAREAWAARLPALMSALDSEDSVEGVRAFQEKRPPVWPGR